jgi:copper homeostasis protein
MSYKLEICVDSIESAITAEIAGADRVELCSSLSEGGTTPGYGLITSVRNNLTIGLHVLIRPRGSDFLYSDLEYDIMRRDIEMCGESGVNGVVLGILNAKGRIDVDRTAKLIQLAHPMTVTFHRAFDMCHDPVKSLDDIIASGASRLLTSGQRNSAIDGAELIGRLVEKSGSRLIVMAGGGITDSNIEQIVRQTKAREYHLTGRKIIQSEMTFRKEGVSMSGDPAVSEFTRKVADREVIENTVRKLNNLLL